MDIVQTIRKGVVLFLTILTACLLCIDTAGGLSFRGITAALAVAFVASGITAYIPQPLRGATQLVVGELTIAISMTDCYCQEFFGTPITPQILSNVLLSDARETHEFASSFLGVHVFAHWRLTALLILALALPVALYFMRKPVFRVIPGYKVWLAVAAVSIACEIMPTYRFMQLFRRHRDLQYTEGLIFRHYHEEVPTPLHRFVFARYSLKLSASVLDDIKRSTFAAGADSCSYQSPHIVLVIGESYNKHHSSLYGYRLPTTPLQQRRKDDGELFVFDDAVTPWNITSNVFLDIFSIWEHGMEAATDEMPLFPILFRRAGYTVNFFSNQYLLKGFRKGATNQAGHFFLADGETSDSLFTFRNRRASKFDLGLVGQVRQFRDNHQSQAYTLDIIHLVGQHFDYALRCPKEDRVFSTHDYAGRDIGREAKNVVMQYDNATHYNDMVVDSILTLYEGEEAIVLYVADHGEEVYDELPIHGRLFQVPTAAQARYEFEVPMWIWCSERYQENHPDVVAAIRASTAKPFMTDGIPQVLLSLAGIKCKWSDDSRNVLSPHYQPRQRTIAGEADYNQLMHNKISNKTSNSQTRESYS